LILEAELLTNKKKHLSGHFKTQRIIHNASMTAFYMWRTDPWLEAPISQLTTYKCT